MRGRLRAWWTGEARPRDAAAPRAPEPAAANAPLPEAEAQRPFWTAERIEVAQRLWGREHVTPGGEDFTRDLLKPLALDPSLTVLELGCGLGGATRLMHRSFGVWPKGLEPDQALAEAGMALSVKAGLAKKAPVLHADLGRLEIKPGGQDRLILRDLLHTVEDKRGVLRIAVDALKKRGQLLLTDFVLADEGAAAAPAVAAWSAGEPVPSRPWSVRALREEMKELKLRVHVLEDETALLRRMILGGWKAVQASLRCEPLPPALTGTMLDEGERWARCAAALDGGALRYIRVVASR